MECNKDEALRAKQIAESRMQIGDFVGALKFATRAQKLFPEIENIVHILTVCEVHCAAQKKLFGSEMDWYGILQTEQVADEATIKKQFRKLALLLHPDKNKFSGAEAAFKLIGEANRLLTDQDKRKLYDMKYRGFMRTASSKPPYYHSNGSMFAQKHDVQARNHQNYSQSTSWNSYQQAAQQTFWTSCNHCKTRYEYYRTVLNATLRCHQCTRPFVAHELGFQHGSPGYKWTTEQKEYPNFESMTKCTYGVDGHCKGQKGEDGNVVAGRAKVGVRRSKPASPKARDSYSSTHIGIKRDRESVPDPRESCKTENGNSVKDANVQGSGIDPSGSKAEAQSRRSSRQKKDVSYSETSYDDGDFESPSKRRRRNGSFSTVAMEEREVPASGGSSKRNHSASSVAGLGGESGEKSNKTSGLPEEILLQKRSKIEQSHVHREEPSKSNVDETNLKADHHPPFNSGVPSIPDIINCPDPDFSDFEKDRADNCFVKDQFWAIYDPSDSMPRYYARVKKVLSPGFKLLITWLEADPDDKGEIDWQDAEMPVGCGKFRLGDTQEIEDRAMFSHQMHNIKGIGRRRYMVYPSKGETWAIFKDWDIKWSSNPEKHCKYEYEYVEILSDFTENIGVEVVYLGKLEGFVSLFQQTERNGLRLFCIPPKELYKFSHRVPSFKMTGDERDGVPCGSFELDPAGLPVDLFGVGNTDVNMGDVMLDAGVKSSGYKSSEQKVENVMPNESGHEAKVNKKNDVERASSILRRSPRGLNRKDMNNGQVNRSQNVTRENSSKDMGCMDASQPDGTDEPSHEGKMHKTNDVQKTSSILRRSPRGLKGRSMENGRVNESQHMTREDGSKYVGCKDFSQPEGIAVEDQAGEMVKTPKKHEKNDCGREDSNVQRSPRDLSKKKAQVDANQCMTGKVSDEHSDANKKLKDSRFSESFGGFCKPFTEGCRVPKASRNMIKSEDMFQRGQIWALYGDKDRMPDIYAQIKKIDFAPDIRLHVAFLEPCSLPKGMTGVGACGTFMVKNPKTRVISISDFSHQLRVKPGEDNRFEIYPRKGEIWALYKNQHRGSTCSNQVRGDCHVVEVLEDDDESSKVVALVRHNDSKPIYKTPRIQRNKNVVINIPRGDDYRFSHQIPAFKHTGDGDTHLKGCWELDPSSVPGFVINLE